MGAFKPHKSFSIILAVEFSGSGIPPLHNGDPDTLLNPRETMASTVSMDKIGVYFSVSLATLAHKSRVSADGGALCESLGKYTGQCAEYIRSTVEPNHQCLWHSFSQDSRGRRRRRCLVWAHLITFRLHGELANT
jgi:hypothetical protein